METNLPLWLRNQAALCPAPSSTNLEQSADLIEDLQEKLKLCFAALLFADLEHDEERCAKSNHFLWCRDCLSYAAQG